MLAAQVHIGTRNSDSQMQDYIWRRRQVCWGPEQDNIVVTKSACSLSHLHVIRQESRRRCRRGGRR